MKDKMSNQPKGSMCVNCMKRDNDCSHLDFNSMRVIEKDNIVKCEEFFRVEKDLKDKMTREEWKAMTIKSCESCVTHLKEVVKIIEDNTKEAIRTGITEEDFEDFVESFEGDKELDTAMNILNELMESIIEPRSFEELEKEVLAETKEME